MSQRAREHRAGLRIASRTRAFALIACRMQKINPGVAGVTRRHERSWRLSDLVQSCVQEMNSE
jgi:hypothetical protein